MIYLCEAHTVQSIGVMFMPSGVIVIGIVTEIETVIGRGIVIVVVKGSDVTPAVLMMKKNVARSHDAKAWWPCS